MRGPYPDDPAGTHDSPTVESGYAVKLTRDDEKRNTMAEPNTRDAKLIQYLNEAYGKEKELETALQAHIAMATRARRTRSACRST